MLLYGDISTNKTEILINKYLELLDQNISSDSILVIVQNSKLKEDFIEKVKNNLKINCLTKFNVYSYFGLCYNMVSEYYPILDEKIEFGKSEVIPNLCGLEASNYIFKNAIEKFNFRGYNSKINLLHQLLRRQSLITLNSLSEEEVKQKTKILKESYSTEIKNAIALYMQKTLELRAFDYLRQVQLFSYLYKKIKNPFKYVFVDDADEMCPSLFEYLKFIKNDTKEFFIAYDPKGSSRKGYLCAQENNFELFLNESPILLDKNEKADMIFEKIVNNEKISIENMEEKSFIGAIDMTDALIEKINSLLNKGVDPFDILVIVPENNEFFKFCTDKLDAPVNFISGSEKIEANIVVSHIITLLKLIVEPESYKVSSYKLRGLLGSILNVDLNVSINIVKDFEASFGEKNLFCIFENYKDEKRIEKLIEIKTKLKDKKLSEILYSISSLFIEKKEENKEAIQKINQLLKQIRDFENIFKDVYSNKELLYGLENTIISENPLEHNKLKPKCINISTLQKAIDLKIENKHLFIYDATNSNWVKQDVGPLYNAWIFQKNWKKNSFELEDNIYCTLDKTARMLRKIFLLSKGEIYMYSSDYNFIGNENFQGIKHFFEKKETQIKPKFNIVPRKDQMPVLEYKKGKFAVMAVAGAGKTTIMLALIVKLLEDGIKPENIFVLTYMDSAARTFKERIKLIIPNIKETPNISTIHGLCLRILRENDNFINLGLDSDFDITDEIKRLKIINEIVYTEGMDTSKTSIYERAISSYKNSKNKYTNSYSPVFKRIYEKYQKTLKSLNLIDYDDLLGLAYELLCSNVKIREYYQNLAHYVIEDEAQDSSSIQQEIINIIAKKYGNIIRSGDINQAITSTFTNSDIKGFRKFIENNPNCKMNYTLRNATGIIDLANILIKKGSNYSKDAFSIIETKPVEGKNIVNKNAFEFKFFNKEEEEKKFILNKINEIFSYEKSSDIGILTRTNKEADDYISYLKSNTNHKIISNTSLLSNNPVFKTVLCVFNFISNPLNNSLIIDFLNNMTDNGFYLSDVELFDEIKNIKKPFILENYENYPLWWDLRYFLGLCTLRADVLGFKIGEYYFINNPKKRINIAPVSSLISKVYKSEGNFEDTLIKLNELIKKGGGNIKLFEDNKKETGQNVVKIMTIHKSKGDEFDYVFIPRLTDKNLSLIPSSIKINEGTKIINSIKGSKKTEDEIKQEIIDENLRLLYVGITRAKKKLYLTTSDEYKIFNKITKQEPSYCFNLLKEEKND